MVVCWTQSKKNDEWRVYRAQEWEDEARERRLDESRNPIGSLGILRMLAFTECCCLIYVLEVLPGCSVENRL